MRVFAPGGAVGAALPRPRATLLRASVGASQTGRGRKKPAIQPTGVAKKIQRRARGEGLGGFEEGLARLPLRKLNFLIRDLGELGDEAGAELVFEWMLRAESPGNACYPNEHTFAQMFQLYGAGGRTDKAVALWNRHADSGEDFGPVESSALLAAFKQNHELEEAMEIFGHICDLGIPLNLYAYNTVLAMLAEAKEGDWERARTVLKRLWADPGAVADRYTYSLALRCLLRSRAWPEIQPLYKRMRRDRVLPDLATYGAFVSALGRAGLSQEARGVFDDLLRDGIAPTTWVYNELIFAHMRGRDAGAATAVFSEMVRAGLRPDSQSISAVMAALSREERWEEALELRARMGELGVVEDANTATAAIRAYTVGGRPEDAIAVLERAESSGDPPATRPMYNAAMIAAQGPDGLPRVLRIYERMQARGIFPNRQTFLVLVRSCERAGDDEKKAEFESLRSEMEMLLMLGGEADGRGGGPGGLLL